MIEKAPHLLSSMQEPSSFFPYIHNPIPTLFSLMDLQGNHVDYALNGKAMLCTAVLLFTAILTLLCFHNYLRILFRHTPRRARRLLSVSTAVGSEGLDSSVIKTIPTIVYGYATKGRYFPPLECAVCLLEFENDEKARVLPKCNHTFHVDCIDMWFYSHSNCPLCRAPIQAVNPVNPEETAGSEPGRDDIETNSSSPFSSSSSSSSSLELEQKPELVRIVVEVPTGAPCGIGFR